jgi:hypothetical protein
VATTPQRAIVPRCLPRQVGTACFEHCQLQQLALDILRDDFIADALQHFAEDQVGEAEPLTIEFGMDPIRLRIPVALEVVDPDSGVDDHHGGYLATRPVRDASRSPSQVTLPRSRRMLF